MQTTQVAESTHTLDDTTFDIRYHLGLIRARFWTIFACAVVVFTFVAIHTFRSTPIYQASARLVIERTLPQFTPFEGPQERGDEIYFATQMKLITSQAVLEKALQDDQVAELFKDEYGPDASRPGLLAMVVGELRAVFAGAPVRPSEPWEQLWGLVEVAPVRSTNLVDVNVNGPNPQQTAVIANAVAKAYVNFSVATRQQSAVVAFEMLQDQRKEQEQALKEAADTRLAYREQTTIPQLGSPEHENVVMDRLATLNAEYTKVQLQRIELSVAAEAVRQGEQEGQDVSSLLALEPIRSDPAFMDPLKSLNDELTKMQLRQTELSAAAETIRQAQAEGKGMDSLLAIGAVRSDPAVTDVRNALSQLRLETQAALRTHGEKHPRVVALKEHEEYLQSQLREAVLAVAESIETEQQVLAKQEEAQRTYLMPRLREGVAATAKAIETEYGMLVQREKELTVALAEQNQLALEQARKSDAYMRLRDDEELQKKVFNVIVDRMKEADLTKDVGVTNVSIVQQASAPRAPVKPNKKRALFLGAFLGLLLGFGVAYGFEYLDDTIKTPEEVEKRLGVPWLGYVPVIAADGANGSEFAQRATHALTSPTSSTTESFRSIRTNIYFSGPRGEMKSLVITSAVPQEGKSVFAANLATTIAQDGKRVLLVDADLRRPQLQKAFNLKRNPGLTNMLVEGRPLSELVQSPRNGDNGSLENLHVLCAGSKTPNPAELLGGEAMAKFVREAREQYDMVIYDMCPAMFVADAAPLSSGADGVVMILKAGKTRRGAVGRARRQLEAVDGKIIGAVLTNVRPKAFGGYGYYGYGYGYYDYDYHRYYREYADDQEQEA